MKRVQPDTTLPREVAIKTIIQRLTQSGTEAPFAETLFNYGEITIVWTRNVAGMYIATITSEASTYAMATHAASTITVSIPGTIATAWPSTNNTISIFTTDAAGTQADDLLQNAIFNLQILKNV